MKIDVIYQVLSVHNGFIRLRMFFYPSSLRDFPFNIIFSNDMVSFIFSILFRVDSLSFSVSFLLEDRRFVSFWVRCFK